MVWLEDCVHLKWRLRESALVLRFLIRIVDSCRIDRKGQIIRNQGSRCQRLNSASPLPIRWRQRQCLATALTRDGYLKDTSGRSDAHRVGFGFEEHRAIFDDIFRNGRIALSLR